MTSPAIASATAVLLTGAAVLLVYDLGHFSTHMVLHVASMNHRALGRRADRYSPAHRRHPTDLALGRDFPPDCSALDVAFPRGPSPSPPVSGGWFDVPRNSIASCALLLVVPADNFRRIAVADNSGAPDYWKTDMSACGAAHLRAENTL
nr:hypothetical protein [Bradyrhizobium retamae]